MPHEKTPFKKAFVSFIIAGFCQCELLCLWDFVNVESCLCGHLSRFLKYCFFFILIQNKLKFEKVKHNTR